jgi:hypothetical protein
MGKVKELMNEQKSSDLAKRFVKNKASQIVGDGSGKATMKDRILPIRDFKNVIEHDKIYLGTLQSLQANLSLHERNLSQKLIPIMNDQDKRLKRAKEFVEWDEVKLKMYDVRGQIESHNTLINDKLFHFDNIALPQYQKEVKEMEEQGFKKQLELSYSITSEKHKELDSKCETIKSEIKDELHWFNNLEDKNKNDQEYMLFLFKAIRRLNNAFADALKEFLEKE